MILSRSSMSMDLLEVAIHLLVFATLIHPTAVAIALTALITRLHLLLPSFIHTTQFQVFPLKLT